MPSVPIVVSVNQAGGDRLVDQQAPVLSTPFGFALIEIQGSLATDPTALAAAEACGKAELDGIGRLEFPLWTGRSDETTDKDDGWMETAYLYVGKFQRMTGRVVRLGRPVGIVRSAEPVSGHGGDEDDNPEPVLEIVGMVRYKIVFATRPEPLDRA